MLGVLVPLVLLCGCKPEFPFWLSVIGYLYSQPPLVVPGFLNFFQPGPPARRGQIGPPTGTKKGRKYLISSVFRYLPRQGLVVRAYPLGNRCTRFQSRF